MLVVMVLVAVIVMMMVVVPLSVVVRLVRFAGALGRSIGEAHGDFYRMNRAALDLFDPHRHVRNAQAPRQSLKPLSGRSGCHEGAQEHVPADPSGRVDDGETPSRHRLTKLSPTHGNRQSLLTVHR
jgi:hypothetical protein